MMIVIMISVTEGYYNILHPVDLQLQVSQEYIMSYMTVWKICIVDRGVDLGQRSCGFGSKLGRDIAAHSRSGQHK